MKIDTMIVVGEPDIKANIGTRNNALNEILNEYTRYANNVIYLGPGNYTYIKNNINHISVSGYSKSSRLIFKDTISVINRVKEVIKEHPNYHIQFRVPSLYTLQIYLIIRSILDPKKISFYIAGDWEESLKYNYPDKKLLKLLPKLQSLVLRNKVCVFTGDTLLNKHRHIISRGHAIYSTTHKESDIKAPNVEESFNRRNICFIGRTEKLKNPNFILRLASSPELRDYQFFILGDGPLKDQLESKAKEKKTDNVIFTGHINDRNRFNNILNSCKYYILPSYTEGTPKTLPEVMSKGILPIAFKNVGSNEYILKNSGRLVDIDSTAQAIDFIKENDENFKVYKKNIDNVIKYASEHSIEREFDSMFLFLSNAK